MSRRILTFSLFESTKTAGLTPEQEEFLNKYTNNKEKYVGDKTSDGTWKYNPATGLVDVDGNFDCSGQGLDSFKGVKFGKVSVNFDCSRNSLTSLEGAPQKVLGVFRCDVNRLTSLEGAPREVKKGFNCSNNQLTTLEGAPWEIRGGFNCSNNNLTTLQGAPQKVGFFSCGGNNLTSLEGAPREIRLVSSLMRKRFFRGGFKCDAFELEKGQWNPQGWLSVLKEGSPEAQQLIATILSPEVLNVEIQKDPTGMIMKLKEVWNDESFKEIRSKLVWPRGYEQEADLLGDLDDVGF